MFQVFITSSAKKVAKKLPKDVKIEIVKHPFDAEKLQKPLDECRSLHFKLNNVHYRIAYRIIKDEQRIDIILVGTRENFYRTLKRVLK